MYIFQKVIISVKMLLFIIVIEKSHAYLQV